MSKESTEYGTKEVRSTHGFVYSYIPLEKVEELFSQIDVVKRPELMYKDLIVNDKKKLYVDKKQYRYCHHSFENAIEFVEMVYNYVVDLVLDLENAVMRCDLIILNERNGKCMLIPEHSKVYLVEAKGKHVFPLVEEGTYINENDRVFYVVTRKFEVRVVRSPVSGVVVYVGEVIPRIPQTYVMVIADENSVKWLQLADRCREG